MGHSNAKIRIQTRISGTASTFNNTSNRFNSKKYNQARSYVRSHRKFIGKKSNRGSPGQQPGVLLQILCCSKERSEEVESNIRSISTEQVHQEGEVQDGNCRGHQRTLEDGRVGNINRFERCLPPYSHIQTSPQVSQVLFQRQSFPVQGSGNGSHFFPTNFHQGNQMHPQISTSIWNESTPVSGRLVDPWINQTTSNLPDRYFTATHTAPRLACEPREVRSDSSTGFFIPFISFPSGSGTSVSNRGTMGENSEENSSFSAQSTLHGKTVAITVRDSNFNREDGEVRDVAHQRHSNRDAQPVVSIQGRSRDSVSDQQQGEESVRVVDNKRQCFIRSTFSDNEPSTSDICRFKYYRLGGSLERFGSERILDRSGERVSHQCTGTIGSVESDGNICVGVERFSSDGGIRQYHSSGLHEEARGNSVESTSGSHAGSLQLVGIESDNNKVSSHTRTSECIGRQSVQRGTNNSNRMVNQSQNTGISVESVVQANGGSVCHASQSQTSNLCITSTRQSILGSGCSIHKLGKSSNLCFSTNCHNSQSSAETSNSQLHNDSHSTILAETEVVSHPIGTISGFSSSTTTMATVTETATVGSISSGSQGIQPPRLEIVKQSLRARGFSEKAAERMSEAQKKSSLRVYEGKWQYFCKWCRDRNVDPLHSTPELVADFLIHLREDRNLAISTIEGYRTAISHTIKATSTLDLGKDPNLSSLMANFYRDSGRKRTSLPLWNLSLVLKKLSESPFEPMHKAELKFVTLKTVFLVALASGKRRSELHAMRQDILHSEGWKSVTIVPDPEFIAKTQLNEKGSDMLNVVTIKALTKILPSDMQEDRALCPVRAIKYYLKQTANIREGKKKLFVAYKKGFKNEIKANTISSWLKKTILFAYNDATDEDMNLIGVKAHQVRSMAASWALHCNASMEDIMNACCWKSANTFISYYLKDLAFIREDMYHLGPVITAAHTSSSSTLLPTE